MQDVPGFHSADHNYFLWNYQSYSMCVYTLETVEYTGPLTHNCEMLCCLDDEGDEKAAFAFLCAQLAKKGMNTMNYIYEECKVHTMGFQATSITFCLHRDGEMPYIKKISRYCTKILQICQKLVLQCKIFVNSYVLDDMPTNESATPLAS